MVMLMFRVVRVGASMLLTSGLWALSSGNIVIRTVQFNLNSTLKYYTISPSTYTDSQPHCLYTTRMPHFPEASQEASGVTNIATREREQEHNDQRPHPPTTNDTQRASRLRIQTRRRRYLDLNPSYFDGSNLEQAGL
jgi:hypothetical protein